jgi:biopolymer transport protein ExbD
MRFRAQQQRQNSMPEVNLVPMMDVIMTILTFFIIVSMTLSDVGSVDIRLPQKSSGSSKSTPPSNGETDPARLVIAIDAKGQLFLDQRPVNQTQMMQLAQRHLAANPKSRIIIAADQSVSYQQVLRTLKDLRDVGGDRVSLSFQ